MGLTIIIALPYHLGGMNLGFDWCMIASTMYYNRTMYQTSSNVDPSTSCHAPLVQHMIMEIVYFSVTNDVAVSQYWSMYQTLISNDVYVWSHFLCEKATYTKSPQRKKNAPLSMQTVACQTN